MSVAIRSIGVHIPERRMANDEIAALVDTTDEWIRSHTGIAARHIAADGQLASDLGADAARMALKKAGIDPKELDLIVVATTSPDFFGFPSTACIIQDKIGAHGCGAFDVVAGCTGFIYALDVAACMLEAKKGRNALVIGTEILTRITDWSDRSSCVLFGDGAGAVVLSRIEESGRGVLKTILGADGGGAMDLALLQTARDKAFERGVQTNPRIFMNGKNVYNFAVKSITVLIGRVLHATMYRLEDFAWIVPHQANGAVLHEHGRIREYLGREHPHRAPRNVRKGSPQAGRPDNAHRFRSRSHVWNDGDTLVMERGRDQG
jgi:3-oxoacyl-[acyl-carrier-protein] synthase-3